MKYPRSSSGGGAAVDQTARDAADAAAAAAASANDRLDSLQGLIVHSGTATVGFGANSVIVATDVAFVGMILMAGFTGLAFDSAVTKLRCVIGGDGVCRVHTDAPTSGGSCEIWWAIVEDT